MCKRGVNVSGNRRNIKMYCLLSVAGYTSVGRGMRMTIWSSSNVHLCQFWSPTDHANQSLVQTDVLFIFYEATILKLFKCIDSECIQACLALVHDCSATLSVDVYSFEPEGVIHSFVF